MKQHIMFVDHSNEAHLGSEIFIGTVAIYSNNMYNTYVVQEDSLPRRSLIRVAL